MIAYTRFPPKTRIKYATKTGPPPFPMSSVRLKKAKAVPLVSGAQTSCKTLLIFGAFIMRIVPAMAAINSMAEGAKLKLIRISIGGTANAVEMPMRRV